MTVKYLQYAAQLSVEKVHKLFALVVLLCEFEYHASYRCQQLVWTHLPNVLLTEVGHSVFVNDSINTSSPSVSKETEYKHTFRNGMTSVMIALICLSSCCVSIWGQCVSADEWLVPIQTQTFWYKGTFWDVAFIFGSIYIFNSEIYHACIKCLFKVSKAWACVD